MSQSRISFNVHAQNIPNNGAFWQYMRQLNPKALYVLDEPGTAVSALEKLPATEVFFRFNGGKGDDGEKILEYTPSEWLNMMLAKVQGEKRIIFSAGNEMPLNKRVVDWMCALIRQANDLGCRVGVLNLAVGNPPGDDPIGAWAVAKPLLELLAEHRQHYLLLHEYFFVVPTSGFYGGWPDNAGVAPGQPGGQNLVSVENWPKDTSGITMYHCGRFKFLLAYCDREGIPYPRIGLSEHGEDALDDVKEWGNKLQKTPPHVDFKGWRTCERQYAEWYGKKGWSPARVYAEMLVYLDKHVYEGSPVEFQCVFSMFQASAEWGPFNVWAHLDFMDRIALYAKETDVTYPTLPLGSDSRFAPAVNESGERYRVRPFPNMQYAENGWIEKGATFYHIPVVEYENWRQVKNAAGIIGWCDAGVFAKAPPKPDPIPLPPDDPEEPPSTPSEPTDEEILLLNLERAWIAVGEACNKLAIASADYAEYLKSKRAEIRESRLAA